MKISKGKANPKQVNKILKEKLEEWFDHTVILQSDDPIVPIFQDKKACCLKYE